MATMKSSEDNISGVKTERERKRKEKKLLKKETLLLAKEQLLEVQGKGVEEESFDELLLAVIGVLDALKHEGNVAGWMRSGGLVKIGGGDQETISEIPETEEMPVTTTTMTTSMSTLDPQTTTLASSSTLTPRSKHDSSAISIQGPSKRRRLTHSHSQTDKELDGEQTMEMDSDSDSDSEMAVSTTPTTKRKSFSVPSSLSPPLRDTTIPIHGERSEQTPFSSARREQALTGVPLSTGMKAVLAASIKTPTYNMDSVSTPTPIPQTPTDPLLWYERACVLSHWVQRGRKALAELEIDVIHGVVSPNQIGKMGGEKSRD